MLPPIWCPQRVTAVETGGTQITFRNGERTALAGIQSIKDAQFSQPCSLPDLHYSSSQSCPECLGGFKWQLQVTHNYFNFCYFLVLTYLLLLSSFFYKAHGNNSVSKLGKVDLSPRKSFLRLGTEVLSTKLVTSSITILREGKNPNTLRVFLPIKPSQSHQHWNGTGHFIFPQNNTLKGIRMKIGFLYLNNNVNVKMSQGLHPFYKVLNQEKSLKRKTISNKL